MIRKVNNNLLLSQYFQNKEFYNHSTIQKSDLLKKAGEENALHIFNQASRRIPAYRDFLKKNNVKPYKIRTINDFQSVPPTTKENYILRYTFKDRSWDGAMNNVHTISTSSGTTGEPCFWLRDLETELDGALQHEFIFSHIFKADKKRTLFLNGFALGNWIAGTFTLACSHFVSFKNYPLINMSPGYNTEEIIILLKKISPYFEQTIISGHTPFLKEVIEAAEHEGVNMKKTHITLLGTGQGITENWRKYIVKKLRSRDYYRTMINLYGSADASLMGFETPQSIIIRRMLSKKRKISKKIFNDERLPSLYNYDPRLIYFEEEDSELHITKYSGCPLIRYNIHDRGGIYSYGDFKQALGKTLANIMKRENIKQNMRLPYVYLFGREKFMVKIFGANVYSEHVQHALNHEILQPLLTGRFIIESVYDDNNDPMLICKVELNPGVEEKQETVVLIEKIFVQEVRKLNSEYDFVLKTVGAKVKPRIRMYKHGHEKYFPKEKIKKTA